MKKILLLTFGGLYLIIVLGLTLKTARQDGTEPGHTGSPGDSLKNCTACHGGTAVDIEGWITSNIPASGYIPGNTYTLVATNTEDEGTRFGFQVSPQDITGKLLGKLVLTDTHRTKLVGNSKYITYTANGVDGMGSNSWTFDWIAPQAGTGTVVFYGAFNSNFNGHKDGDQTFLSTLQVKEAGTEGVANIVENVNSVSIYPNPASDRVAMTFTVAKKCIVTIDVLDINGKQVVRLMNEVQSGPINKQFSLAGIPDGNYLIRVQADGQTVTHKINVTH